MPEILEPGKIEERSFQIITELLGDIPLNPEQESIIKRVIHTTADLSFAESLTFTPGAVAAGLEALAAGRDIVTDTQMALAGINKAALAKLGGSVHCFMADPEVSAEAKRRGVTRAAVSMERAAALPGPCIFAIGNAPTALLTIADLVERGALHPALVIGVPVGFVNVVESKERILELPVESIVARGRKGGSAVAAAVCNALMYKITRK